VNTAKRQNLNVSNSGLFVYLLAMTGIFSLLEFSFATQGSGLYLADFKLVADHLRIPTVVLGDIFFYVFAQIFVHVTFTFLIWVQARGIGAAFHYSWSRIQTLGFSLWVVALITALLANQYYFPNSKFSSLTEMLVSHAIAIKLLMLLFGLEFAIFIIAMVGIVSYFSKYLWIISPLLFAALFIPLIAPVHHPILANAASAEKPNIILIGVDSLRPDFLGYFGRGKNVTPHLDAFLDEASVFSEALTPLARTFPAWVSILTGKYPKVSGARTDLADQTHLNKTDALPAILQKAGYETIYAMDETRFSNIDSDFGFDHVVTPPVGFNDFLLGTYNDFPLSNLLINTRIGQWLFPFSYSNRAAYVTYDPNSFIKLMTPVLAQSHDKPVFLAVHFCLPHYPYFWSGYSPAETPKAKVHYRATVKKADEQVNNLLTILKEKGLLKHAIVVLLSDHGEALEFFGDRITESDAYIAGKNNPKNTIPIFYPPTFDFETVNQSAGHGTDVLGLPQYHSVLAFRSYGCCQIKPSLISGIVSLLDIKPTILDILKISSSENNGYSLLETLRQGKLITTTPKDFFMESDFSPEAVRTVHPETRKILFQGIDYFQIDQKTARLTVKPSMNEMINSSKQFADIYGSWILAVYPQANKKMMPILVNLQTGQWTDDLETAFANNSPARHMLGALNTFFSTDLINLKI